MNINYYNPYVRAELELWHYGVPGQRHGERNGPPYPLRSSQASDAEKKAGWTESEWAKGNGENTSKKNKIDEKLFRKADSVFQNLKEYRKAGGAKGMINYKTVHDLIISKGTAIDTLSYNPTRTTDTDMFFGAYKAIDKHQYNAMFNRPIKDYITNEDGTPVPTKVLKYRIRNIANTDMKVASEQSGANAFSELCNTNRSFKDFVVNPEKMMSAFDKTKFKFAGYREANAALKRIQNGNSRDGDMSKVYRLFNYVIPSDGRGNEKLAADVLKARKTFFRKMRSQGYGALLDTNDAKYGGFKAQAPVIVIDMKQFTLDSINRVSMTDKRISQLVNTGSQILKRLT